MTRNSQSVLILGANGRFGLHCAQAFGAAGWQVHAQTRPSSELDTELTDAGDITHCPVDLDQRDVLTEIAKNCSLIVNALNPPYGAWDTAVPQITSRVLALAKSSGATVLIPGNVYNFGANMPQRLLGSTPHAPTNKWGTVRMEMEQAYRNASKSGVRTIILRIGDFLQREESGNWFDTHMIAGLNKGKFVYPGDPAIPHAFGYLPDAARAAVELAKIREELPDFADVPFPGTTFTGDQLTRGIAEALNRPVRRTTIPWIFIRLMALFNKDMRGVLAKRYLWNTPHELDGAEFNRLLPGFVATPKEKIIKDIVSRYA